MLHQSSGEPEAANDDVQLRGTGAGGFHLRHIHLREMFFEARDDFLERAAHLGVIDTYKLEVK